MHDMGNSLGGMASYMELLNSIRCIKVEYIRVFKDQAIQMIDPYHNQKGDALWGRF